MGLVRVPRPNQPRAGKGEPLLSGLERSREGGGYDLHLILHLRPGFQGEVRGSGKPLAEDQDTKIELLLRQKWIRPIVVDEKIGTAARRAMRHHPECKKPSDAIHLVTALALNVDEMNTFDGSDLLKLDGKISRDDGKPLKINIPTPAPVPVKQEPRQSYMFAEPHPAKETNNANAS